MKRRPVAVIGLGNMLFQDEGTGLHATALLEELYPDLPVDIIQAGTPGFTLLHQFEDRKKVIFLDAGYCEAEPGEFRRFVKEDVISLKKPGKYSLHQFDLISFLNSAEEMGFLHNVEVSIYCMQLGETYLSGNLSKAVKTGINKLVRAVYHEVNEYMVGHAGKMVRNISGYEYE
ncbi:MAG: hydrogenase maturation protease [Spirochaetales bacterium]|nr:hydrogenase maturation protease [Spirochaetales bacterium]